MITFLGLSTLPNFDFYHKKLYLPKEEINYWQRWANWDSGAFLYISQHGYLPSWTVFFPGYPLMIKLISLSGLTPFWSGFLVSQLCTILLLFYLYKLIILDFDSILAKRALFALLIFPTSFYLVSVYSESLFLATTLAAFYYGRNRRWFLAAALSALASITRPVGLGVILGLAVEYLAINSPKIGLFFKGILGRLAVYLTLMIIALAYLNEILVNSNNFVPAGVVVSLIEFLKVGLIVVAFFILVKIIKSLLQQIKFKKIISLKFLYLLSPLLPVTSFLIFQKLQFGSFLTFLKGEQVWVRGLHLPWSGAWYSFGYLLSNFPKTTEFSAHILLRVLVFTLSLILLIKSFNRLRFCYIVFYLIAFTAPLVSGTLADFARYNIVIFPMFIVLGSIKNELVQRAGIILSVLLLSFLVLLYFNSYFFV